MIEGLIEFIEETVFSRMSVIAKERVSTRPSVTTSRYWF